MMDTIPMRADLLAEVRANDRTSSVRRGLRNYGLGPAMLVDDVNRNDREPIWIYEMILRRFHPDHYADEYVMALQDIYTPFGGPLKTGELVTVISFHLSRNFTG